MGAKKKIAVVLIIAIAIIALFLIFNHSYTIENANLDLTVHKDGSLHINEEYDYSFKGEFNGVYRKIPLKSGEYIDNIKVTADGAYPVVKEDNEYKYGKSYKIYLYADPQHTQKIRDCNVKVKISYDFLGVTMLFDDIGGLQYKLWGEGWDTGVENFEATIHLPGDSNNNYSLNPTKLTESSSLNGDTLKVKSAGIPQGEIYEILVMMPRDDFDSEAPYGQENSGNGRELAIKNLNDSLNDVSFWETISTFYKILACLGPVLLILTYLKFGREPKVDYDGVYERELPSDDPPEVINTLFSDAFIGTADMNGFESSILNLIDRKIIDISTEKDSETDTNDLILTFHEDKKGELSQSEGIVFDALSGFATDNVLNLSTLNNRLSSVSNAKWFMGRYDSWKETVEEKSEEKRKGYFDTKGSNIGMAYGLSALILGFVLFFVAGLMPTPALRAGGMQMAIIIGVTGLVAVVLPKDYLGRWTSEGRVMFLKWKNFKTFLKDNSLIAEHPPESIAIWKKYLIYGAALGVADEVHKAMKLHEPNVHEYDDGMFLYHSYGGYAMMHHAIRTGESTANPSSSGGGSDFGGFGGGSGGGGGGAF